MTECVASTAQSRDGGTPGMARYDAWKTSICHFTTVEAALGYLNSGLAVSAARFSWTAPRLIPGQEQTERIQTDALQAKAKHTLCKLHCVRREGKKQRLGGGCQSRGSRFMTVHSRATYLRPDAVRTTRRVQNSSAIHGVLLARWTDASGGVAGTRSSNVSRSLRLGGDNIWLHCSRTRSKLTFSPEEPSTSSNGLI